MSTITMFTTPGGTTFGLGTVDLDGKVEPVPSVPCPRCQDGKEQETSSCCRCDGKGQVLAPGLTADVFLNRLSQVGSLDRLLNG